MAMGSPTSPIPPPLAPPVVAGGQAAPTVPPYGNSSLYVGDLDQAIAEEQLFSLFNSVAPVVSVRVCRDQVRRTSLGYGYVNFHSQEDAASAMQTLNCTLVNGKAIRVMFSHRDPSVRKSGQANVFIKNIEPSIETKTLLEIFSNFGRVLSIKIATDINGQSKGYGFIQFEQDQSAENAINQLNGMLMNGKKIYVGYFIRRQERDQSNGTVKFTNVYVKNLPEAFTDEDLKREFAPYGEITSSVIMRGEDGKSKCFGFVNFERFESAKDAVEGMNGRNLGDNRILYVSRAQKKAEREAELKERYEMERNGRIESSQGLNLYIKNIDEGIDDSQLEKLFSEFGEISSCKVMVDGQGRSKGSGFVSFSTTESASRAITEMNGRMVGKKPIFVGFAQRKEERRAMLAAHFTQLHATGTMLPIQGFHAGPPSARMGPPQQIYLGQAGAGPAQLVPPQAGYPFQQIPGMRAPPPAVAPNFIMSYGIQQRQSGPPPHQHRFGGRRVPHQHHQPQMMQRNPNQGGYRYVPNGRNGIEGMVIPPQSLISPVMTAVPLDGPTPAIIHQLDGSSGPHSSSIPITALTTALASASPEHQRIILGEQLFPLVEGIEREQAGKVTGMLLEMDQNEVLHLIESPDALQSKVGEALEVLRLALGSTDPDASNQFGVLSLND